MYNTSTAYKTEIKKPSRSFECKVTIGNNIYNNDDIVDIILDTVQPQEGFSIGNTPSQTLDLTLLNKGDIIYSTNQVKVEIGLKIDNTIEYVLMGYFNIDDIEKTDYTTKITAYDNMIKFETSYFSSLVDTATLQQVVNELATKTGVQFTGSLPAYTVSKLEGFTCREMLGYVASLCGGNALITRDGKFTVVYPKDINYSISADNYFDYKREEVKYKIGKVSCKSEDKELNKGSLGTDSMELQFENPWVNESILNDIYTKLNGFTYLGYTMKWQGDLSLDIGDIITCTDTKGIVRKLPILSQKFTYTGGLTSEIGAKGETKNKNSFNSSGSNTKKLERVVIDQALIKEALIDVAHIGDLTAGKIKVDILEGGTAILQNIITNFISGESGQFVHLTGANVVIDNAVIKDAMIESLNVSKINAGDISTNKFRIKSDNGGIEIVGATQQFKDKNNKVRIQMGQDTQGSFNFILRGEDGTTTLIDHNGIKEKAIANDLIKGNMISENAVGSKQIDYNSFTEEFNKDTNTHTLKSSKVLLDETNQTLNIAFNRLDTKVDSAPPKVTTDNSITMLDGAIDGMLKLNSIKGRTLQNLMSRVEFLDIEKAYSTTSATNIQLVGKGLSVSTVKPNTEYTFIFKVNFTNLNLKNFYIGLNYLDKLGVHKGLVYQTLKNLDNGKLFIVKMTTPDDISSFSNVFLGGNDGYVTVNMGGFYMILEGDYTNKPIPSYFEGIRSVGETGENLEVVSCGNNLCNNKWEIGSLNSLDGTDYPSPEQARSQYLHIGGNKTYTLGIRNSELYNSIFYILYNTNKKVIGKGGWSTSSTVIISAPNECRYIRVLVKNKTATNINILTPPIIQLEEGTIFTQYEPYQEHRQPIALTEPLRGLPNGVRDYVDFEKGIVIREIGKVVLNGSEGWTLLATATTNTMRFQGIIPFGYKKLGEIICDRFNTANPVASYVGEIELIGTHGDSGAINIMIDKTRLTTQDMTGFKAWLKANPITVYYQLATPVETPIKVERYMKQFKDGYFITDGSLILPIVEFDYSTSLASATSMMKEVTESNSTYLNVQQGKIDSLISNTTIVKDGKTIQLKDSYNSTVATVDSINSTIGKHTSTIDALTGQITGVDTKVNTVQRDLDGVKTTVSNATTTANSALSKATEAKQTADGFSQKVSNIETNYATTSAMNTAITQSATGIKSEVSNAFVSKSDASITYATKTSLTQTENSIVAKFTSSGGYNLLKNSAFANKDTINWSLGGGWNRYPTYTSTYYTEHGCMALYPVSASNARGLIGQTLSENLKKNTKYTFSLKTFWEKNIIEVNLYMDYTKNGAYVANTIHKFSSSYDRQSYTFTSPNVDFDTVKFYVEIKSNGVSGNWVARVIKPCLCEGDIAVWGPHPGELIDGYTQIDGSGVTIYDGALTIKNRLGQDVLTANVAGNLNMIGMITTFNSDMTKRQIELIKNDINFYDWETAANNLSIGRIYTGKQVVNGLAISTPALSIRNTPASYISISSERSMLMHFDDYNRSTYSGNIPIWFYKNAIMGIGASMYFNMPGNKGDIYGANGDVLVISVPVKATGNGFQVQSDSGSRLMNARAGYSYVCYLSDTYIDGKFAVSGSKNSIQKTKNYGERLINAYETAEYYFGDIGSGKIINGECVVYIDDIFQECINTKHQYHIFTQVYNGSITKIERLENHFIVYGAEETEFSWELKAKRLGYENHRLETTNDFDKTESYENMFNRHFEEFEAEKTTERQSVEGDMYTNDTLAGDMLVTELDFRLDDFLLNKEEI